MAFAVTTLQSGLKTTDLVSLTAEAMSLARFVKTKARTISTEPEATAVTSAFSATTALASLAKRMANAEDVEAKGRINDKDVTDSRELRQEITRIDGVTGSVQTGYVTAGARGKK